MAVDKRYDFLIVGSVNFDILVKQDRFPNIGETLQAIDAVTCPGGKGANQAIQVGKLGGNVGFFGAVGDDIFGRTLEESLVSNNVDTALLLTKPGSSGLGLVSHIEGGRLTSTIIKGANYLLTPGDIDPVAGVFRDAAFLILQNEIPEDINRKAIDIATAGGTKVLLNAAPVRPIDDEFFNKVDYLILNEVEASYYLEQDITDLDTAVRIGQEFVEKHGLILIITLGPMGSVAITGTDTWKIDPIDVPVVETTGAGDSYIGALVYYLFHGETLDAACRFANCASSITIQGEGALPSMPDFKSLMNLYNDIYNSY